MIEIIAYLVSSLSGLALFILAGLVCMAYYQRGAHDTPSRLLGLAIIIAFASAMANTFYWQVVGQALLKTESISIENFRLLGSFLDLAFKGTAAYAAYLHLKCLYLSLPREERKFWSPLSMSLYPHKEWRIYKIMTKVRDFYDKTANFIRRK